MRWKGIRRKGLLAAAVLAIAGCDNGLSNAWWNGFLDPTAVGNFRDDVVTDIQRSISFRDTPVGIVGAEDPKPSDLIADVEEYEIGPGDTLQISLLDFIQLGAETNLTPTVDDLGYIELPQLDRIRATGRTARELKSDIIQKAKSIGVYNQEDEPTVTVSVANPMQRMYNLFGQVLYPGPYRIARPDFRVREAINLGGGMDETIKYVWVYRNGAKPQAASAPAPAGGPDRAAPAIPLPPPPVSPVLMSDLQTAGSPPSPAASRPQPSERTPTGLALPSEDVPKDLIEAVAPPKQPEAKKSAGSVPASNTASGGGSGTSSNLPSYKFVNDKFEEVPAGSEASPKKAPAPAASPARSASGEPVDWEALASETKYRIIRIPADKLRNGDPNYNIVIKHEDWVRVDPGPVGLYYMDGYVNRPGPYALAGEQITLTQALAAAGGLNQLAWPTRCEVRRRLDGDREEITQWDLARIVEGKDPDMYLKPNDLVRVGTHALAPLLATLRNSFRFTYGFGFVYDRNFADIDSFNAQINPKDRHRAERQTRFGNLFQ